MSVLKKNIVANLGGNVWTALMSLVFVPLYIHFMGIEVYGLVGFFAILLALFSLLDMGLSTTLNREMARMALHAEKSQEMRDLLRTLEIPYWLVGLLIALIVVGASPLIAYRWVNVEDLDPKSVRIAIMLMGLCVAFRWPVGLYSGGLMGLQRQVLLNGINVVVATFRGLGAVLILWLVSPTVEAFFSWQIAVSAAHVGLTALFLWRSLPYAAEAPRFRRQLLLNIWSFTAGMTGITVTGLLLTQADKILLSKLLTLEEFGYYSLATVAATSLHRLIGPLFTAVFPRFSELVSLRDDIGLRQLYHKSCQFLAVATLPAAMILVFFPSELLLLWTGDSITVSNTYPILRLLAIGAALNGLMNIPYALTLSYGWLKLTIYSHIIAIIVIVPMLVVLINQYGVLGAPIGWIVFNASLIAILVPTIHSRLLRKEKRKWYLHDVGKPLAVALAVACFWRMGFPTCVSRLSIFLLLSGVFLTTLTATALATSSTRSWITKTLIKNVAFSKLKVARGEENDARQ